jgi:alpha-glucosidase
LVDEVCDPFEKNVPGLGLGRDPQRTPMQWDASEHAGFSRSRPWLPVAPDFGTRNVAVHGRDPKSILSLYRELLSLRRSSPALAVGSYRPLGATPQAMGYLREATNGERFAIFLNLSSAPCRVPVEEAEARGAIVLTTDLERVGELVREGIELRGGEGAIVRCSGP